jgi:hypothetical protein
MWEGKFKEVEEKLLSMKSASESGLALLDRIKRLIKIMEDIDKIYQTKIKEDPTWIENFNTFLSDDKEKQLAEILFLNIHNFLNFMNEFLEET